MAELTLEHQHVVNNKKTHLGTATTTMEAEARLSRPLKTTPSGQSALNKIIIVANVSTIISITIITINSIKSITISTIIIFLDVSNHLKVFGERTNARDRSYLVTTVDILLLVILVILHHTQPSH